MKFVKFALMGFGVLGAVLSLVYGVMAAGVHGVIVLVGCLLPVAFGAMSIVTKKGMPRWASAVSLVALLVVAMKTTEGDDLQNVMMAATAGMICAIILLIKPDAPADPDKSARIKATLRN